MIGDCDSDVVFFLFCRPYLVARMSDRAPRDRHGRFYQLGRVITDRWETQYMPYKTVNDVDKPVVNTTPAKGKDAAKVERLPRKHFPVAQLATERGITLTPELRGRISLDLCSLIRGLSTADKYLAFKNYTLDNMAARFLKDNKVNFGHNDIFDAWNGTMPGQRMLKILSNNPDEQDTSWLTSKAPNEVEVNVWLTELGAPTLPEIRALAQERQLEHERANAERSRQREELRQALRDPQRRAEASIDLAAKLDALKPLAHPEPVENIPLEAQRRLLGDYCMKDSMLPLRIADHLGTVMFLWQVARVSATAPHNVINNGQMMRASTLFIKEAWLQNRVVNKVKNRAMDYQGATVLPPKRGYYGGASMDDPPDPKAPPLPKNYDYEGIPAEELVQRLVKAVILTLDFKSLYPSIIRAHHLCPSLLYQPDEPLTPSEQSAVEFEAFLKVRSMAVDLLAGAPLEPIGDVSHMNETQVRANLSLFQHLLEILKRSRNDNVLPTMEEIETALKTLEARLRRLTHDEGIESDDDGDGDDDADEGDDDDDDDENKQHKKTTGTDEVVADETDSLSSGVVLGLSDAEDYLTVRVIVTDDKGRTVGERYHKYSRHSQGIYPILLKTLLDGRDVYKKKMNVEKEVLGNLEKYIKDHPVDEGHVSEDKGECDAAIETLRAEIQKSMKKPTEIPGIVSKWVETNAWVLDADQSKESLNRLRSNIKIYDGRQLALKVMANSIYGVSGAKQQSPCACCQLAESVTAIGRQMIQKSKNCAEIHFKHYGCNVIYGGTLCVGYIVSLMQWETSLGFTNARVHALQIRILSLSRSMKPMIAKRGGLLARLPSTLRSMFLGMGSTFWRTNVSNGFWRCLKRRIMSGWKTKTLKPAFTSEEKKGWPRCVETNPRCSTF